MQSEGERTTTLGLDDVFKKKMNKLDQTCNYMITTGAGLRCSGDEYVAGF